MKRLTLLILVGAMSLSSYSYVFSLATATPFKISGIFVNSDDVTRPDDDTYNVTVELQDTNSTTANALYSQSMDVTFQNGYFSITLGSDENPIEPEWLSLSSPNVSLELNGTKRFFALTSVPYAIRAELADDVIRIESDKIVGTFTNTTNIDANISVFSFSTSDNPTFTFNKDTGRFGINNTEPDSDVDVSGTVQGTTFYKNGIELAQALTWKPTANNAIYLPAEDQGMIGIGTTNPKWHVDVAGTINATTFLTKGSALTAGLEWVNPTGSNSEDVYFNKTSGNVGIGYVDPSSKLDIRYGMIIGNTTSNNEGSMKWDTEDYFGYTPSGWQSLSGITGVGIDKSLAQFDSDDGSVINALTHLTYDYDHTQFGIGTSVPLDRVTIKTHADETTGDAIVQVVTTENEHVLYVDGEGNMGVGTSDPEFLVDVNGLLNAEKILIEGVDFRNAIRSGTYWYFSNDGIYYNLGNVGIGRPDPGSKLEIAQPNGRPDIDPAITFALGDDSTASSASYSIGVDTNSKGLFRVESGSEIGSSNPVFVSIDDRMGIGLEFPNANLHVSGNTGLIFGGNYLKAIEDKTGTLILTETTGLIPTEPMRVTGNGTRLMWYPPVSALRIGHLDEFAPLGGEDWNHTWRETEYNEVGVASNVGKYSTVIGRNSVASGNFSTVLGGRQHQLGGAYSSAFGGNNLKSQGAFSLAMGSNVAAQHHGSFIFGHRFIDETSTTTENQFVIVSKGVGIGVNQTSEAELTIGIGSTDNVTKVFNVENEDGSVFAVYPSGDITVGFDGATDVDGGLMVEDSMAINTTDAKGALTIDSTYLAETLSTDNLVYNILTAIGIDSEVSSPAFVVNNLARVGIGKYPDEDPRSVFVASGNIAALGYELPTGETLDGSAPVIVWNWEHATPNIFFPSGNINDSGQIESTHNYAGIGTTSPNSLLELSYLSVNPEGSAPVVTIEQDLVDRFSFGVLSAAAPYFQVNEGGSLSTATPSFTIKDYVGIGTSNPETPLHAAGTIIFADNLGIGSENTTTKSLSVASTNIFSLFIDGEKYSPAGVKWDPLESPTRIYYNNLISSTEISNVGIQTLYPQTELDVSGNIRGTGYYVSDVFNVKDSLRLDLLKLRENNSDFVSELYVEDTEWILDGSAGRMSISAVISEGEATLDNPTGKLAFWVIPHPTGRRTFLTEADMIWNDVTPSITLNGSYSHEYSNEFDNSGVYKNYVKIGTPNLNQAIDVYAELDHNGNHEYSFSHALVSMNIHVDDWDNNLAYADSSEGTFNIKGIDIKLNQPPGVLFSKNGEGIGLNVDLENVNVQSAELGSEGHKYSAIFNGFVGIGGTPNADLDVYGQIIADEFNVTERLDMVTVNVNEGTLFVETKVGIGTESPETDLEIVGAVSATDVVLSSGFESPLLDFENNVFTIKDTGQIGLGTTEPTALLDLQKSFDARGDDFSFKSITVTLNTGSALDSDITLFESYVTSNSSDNFIGRDGDEEITVIPLNIDFSNLESEENGTIVGIDVTTVTGNTGTMYSAIFQNGNVGIGTTTPASTASLHVKGTIRAQNFPSTQFLTEQESASFNNLALKDAYFSGNASVYDVQAEELYQYEEMVIASAMDLPLIDFTIGYLFSEKDVSINGTVTANDMTVFGSSTANDGYFNQLIVGTAGDVDSEAYIGSVMRSTELIPLDELTAVSVSINNSLYEVGSSGKIGIGNSDPLHNLEITTDFGSTFSDADNSRWRNLYIQNLGNDSGDTGTAAGVEFSFSGSTAGFAAVSTTSATATGSSLVFITSDTEGNTSEKLRITEEGNIAIGTTNATGKLQILGGANVSESLIGEENITISELYVEGTVTASPSINVYQDIELNNKTYVNQLLLESGVTTPDVLSNYSNIFVENEGDDNLIFTTELASGAQITASLTTTLSSDSNKLPYFGSDSLLTASPGLHIFTGNISTIWVGTSNAGATLAHEAYISTQNNGIINMNHIKMGVDRRITSQTLGDTIIAGVDISVTSSSQAMIADDDLFYGVYVDLENLTEKWQNDLGEAQVGFKYAALFNGGAVQIGKNNAGVPSADLFVDSISSNGASANNVLWVSGTDENGTTETGLVINPTGNVAIGAEDTSTDMAGSGKLFITGIDDGTSKALQVVNNSGTSTFAVFNNGALAAGSVTPTLSSFGIEAAGTAKGTNLTAGTLTAQKIDMESNFYTADNGKIGIGTTNPGADLEYYYTLVENPASDFILSKGSIILEEAQSENFTGLALDFISSSNASISDNIIQSLADTPVTVSVRGIDVDITTLPSADITTGLYINLGNGATTNTAARFMGGNVGIGTSQPSDELTVVGSVNATTFISSQSISYINKGIFEELDVTSSIDIGTLKAYSVGVKDTLHVEENSKQLRDLIDGTTLNINEGLFANVATFNTVGIDETSMSASLNVNGQALIDVATIDRIQLLGVTHSITSSPDITIKNTLIRFPSTVNMSEALYTAQGIKFNPLATNAEVYDSEYLPFFVDSDNDFVAMFGNGTSTLDAKISTVDITTTRNFLYFNADRHLVSIPEFAWAEGDKYTYQLIGASLNMASTFNPTQTTPLGSESIALSFEPRIDASNTTFIGAEIIVSGNQDFNDDNIVAALRSDVSTLRAKYFAQNFSYIDSKKVAAAFLGGAVKIGADLPSASLHIAPTFNSEFSGATFAPAFKVETSGNDTGIAITTLNIAIGTDTEQDKLFKVQGDSNTYTSEALSLLNSDTSGMFLKNNGFIGIGTNVPSATVHLSSSSSDLFTVSNNIVHVDSDGNVGFNTDVPSGTVHVKAYNGTNSVLKITSGNVKYVDMIASGQLGINVTSDDPLEISNNIFVKTNGIFQSGDLNTGNTYTLIDYAQHNYGLASISGSDDLFFGVSSNNHAYLSWGDNGNQSFKIQHATEGDLLTVTANGSEGRVGYGESSPVASLHITERNDDTSIIILDGNITSNILEIDSSGKIGFNSETGTSDVIVGFIDKTVTVSLVIDPASATDYAIFDERNDTTLMEVPILGLVNRDKDTGVYSALQIPSDNFLVSVNVTGGTESIAHGIKHIVNTEFTKDVIGVNVNFKDEGNTPGATDANITLGTNYNPDNSTYASTESVYGVRVDVSNVNIFDPDFSQEVGYGEQNGDRYPLGVQGGSIGIGTLTPSEDVSLHVVVSDMMVTPGEPYDNVHNLVESGTLMSLIGEETSLRTYIETTYLGDSSTVNLIEFVVSNNNTEYSPLFLGVAQNTTDNSFQPVVGMGVVSDGDPGYNLMDKALVVSGDVYVGVKSDAELLEDAGYGNFLYFSGAPLTGALDGWNSDNSDTFYFARYNDKSDSQPTRSISELRVFVGESETENPYAKMDIGHFRDESWYSVFTAKVYGIPEVPEGTEILSDSLDISTVAEPEGGIGIGTSDPVAALHVYGAPDVVNDDIHTNGTTIDGNEVLVLLENNTDGNAMLDDSHSYSVTSSILSIQHDGFTATTFPESDSNFITFYTGTEDEPTAIGSIEGGYSDDFGTGGVSFTSGGADYAEYISKLNKDETMEPGDIIGIQGGKATKQTDASEHFMIVSSSPLMVGNWQGSQSDENMVLTAFLGQVPIKIKGQIKAGDYIIPSGKHDGYGVGVRPENVSFENVDKIVGRSWETSLTFGKKKVKAIVGFPFSKLVLAESVKKLDNLKEQKQYLQTDAQSSIDQLKKTIEDRQKLIDKLQEEVNEQLSKR